MAEYYNWFYNTYNDNKYVLLFIIILLILYIFVFEIYSNKQSINNIPQITSPDQQKSNFSDIPNISNFSDLKEEYGTSYTHYQPPLVDNPSHNLFISKEEKDKWKVASSLLDGNEDSLPNTNGAPYDINPNSDSPKGYKYIPKNDILNVNSTLFDHNNDKIHSTQSSQSSSIGDYATLNSIGEGLTDTLGGINFSLGYTILKEHYGKFKKDELYNPYTYDNTSNYNNGMQANTVDGNGGYGGKNGPPVFIQKDFDGVSNIFAPNIIIQNPPLTSDGYPDISVRM